MYWILRGSYGSVQVKSGAVLCLFIIFVCKIKSMPCAVNRSPVWCFIFTHTYTSGTHSLERNANILLLLLCLYACVVLSDSCLGRRVGRGESSYGLSSHSVTYDLQLTLSANRLRSTHTWEHSHSHTLIGVTHNCIGFCILIWMCTG